MAAGSMHELAQPPNSTAPAILPTSSHHPSRHLLNHLNCPNRPTAVPSLTIPHGTCRTLFGTRRARCTARGRRPPEKTGREGATAAGPILNVTIQVVGGGQKLEHSRTSIRWVGGRRSPLRTSIRSGGGKRLPLRTSRAVYLTPSRISENALHLRFGWRHQHTLGVSQNCPTTASLPQAHDAVPWTNSSILHLWEINIEVVIYIPVPAWGHTRSARQPLRP